ncbi:MAG: tetratricopeptide repeat protein [Candidatus Krumholzibacteriia bacterium]
MASTAHRISVFLDALDGRLTADRRWLVAVFVASFLLKFIYVLQSANSLHVTVPIMDSEYYVRTAGEILGGKIVRDEAFYMGPLYPYFLSVIFGIFGKSIMAVRILQIIGGSLTVVLTCLVGRRLFRPSAALVAAIMLTLYGTMTFYEGQLLMMWLGTLINMAVLYVLVCTRDDSPVRRYVLIGFLLGLSVLARANILLFAVVVLAWIVHRSGGKRRVPRAGAFVAALAVTVLPATVHNYLATRDFVPVTSNGGVNFYIGNSEHATGVFYPPRGVNVVSDRAVRTYVGKRLGREVSDAEVSRYWYREAFDFMRTNPGREIRLLLRKTAMFFSAYEMPHIDSYLAARSHQPMLRFLFVSFWMIVSLALMGMIYSLRKWREYFLLYGYVLAFSLSVILFFITARYRAQVAPALCLFAAQALLFVLPRAVSGIRRSLVPVILFAVILVATRPGLFALPERDVEWREHTHRARRLSQTNRHQKAIEEMDKAVEIHPDYPESYIQRAVIYKTRNNDFKAISDYSRALKIDPALPTVQYDLGQSLRRVQMYEPAAEAYRKAVELDPAMTQAYNNLGITCRQLKQYDKAAEYFEKVIEIDPGYTKAYNNLGATLAEAGDPDRAIEIFKKAIDVDPGYANSYKNLAMAHVHNQQVREAAAALQKYLTLAPGDERARGMLEQLRSVLRSDTLQGRP